MDNDNHDNNNDNNNASFYPHSLTSNNNNNYNSHHTPLLRHTSRPSEFYSESITDAHFSPVAVSSSGSSSGTSATTDHTATVAQPTAATTVIAIDSLAITSPSSSSTSPRPKKVAKRGAQKGSTFTFPSISVAAPASTQGVSASSSISKATTTTTTMAARASVEPAVASAVTTSISAISTNTSATTTVSRPTRTGRHNRGERMTFELDDVLREYTPDQFKTCKAYDVGGVNILNKKPVDSKTALDKIKRRRETHNRVERRRRDCINQLIDELTALLPKEDDNDISKSHRVNILRTAITHIQNLTRQNENLQQQVDALKTGRPMPPPAIITTLAPTMDYDDEEKAYSDNIPSPSSASYSAYSPRSPLSPSVSTGGGAYSPISSPGGPSSPYHPLNPSVAHGRESYQDWTQSRGHLNPSSGGAPTSYPIETTASITASTPDIPMIVEPSEQISTPELGSSGMGSKRLNRQTLPRLQLAPPPFHQHSQHHNQHQQQQQQPLQHPQQQKQQGHYQHQHQHHGYPQQQHQHYHDHIHQHRSRSNSGGGYPQSPSYYGHDSASATSPNSTYSDYSSSTAPWSSSSGGPYSAGLGGIGGGGPLSSTSSSFGTSPRSPHFSNHGPPSPYSPYGPSSAHARMSPSPGLAPWNAILSSSSPSTVPHPSGGPKKDHPSSPRP